LNKININKMVRKSSKGKDSSSDWPPRPLPLSLSTSRLPASLKNLKAFHLLNQNQNPINNSLKYLKLTPLNSSKTNESPVILTPPAEKEPLVIESTNPQEACSPGNKRRVSRCACSTSKGQIDGILKEHNQDSVLLIPKVNNVPYQFLFGVFDGHGEFGHSISSLIKSRIKSTTSSLKASTLPSDLISYVEHTISLVAQTIKASPIDCKDSGSTLNLVLVSGNQLVCGNVGDSRCVMGKLVGNEWKSEAISTDHKPDNQEEFTRITKAGGIIDTDLFGSSQSTILRVWSNNPASPGLAMTRSIGDKRMAKVGVTSIPDIFERQLSIQDKLVILATDGLWDVVNSLEAVMIAGKCIKAGHAKIASQTLVDIAKQRWTEKGDSIDDISVIVVLLNSKI
jgi:serine/threonine protein phosphatase PrpC